MAAALETDALKVRCAHSKSANLHINHSRSYSDFDEPSHQHDIFLHKSHSQEDASSSAAAAAAIDNTLKSFHQPPLSAEDEGLLPFFPRFESQWLCDLKLLVAWFEENFSQGSYNTELINNGSNACTLIAILLSSYCSREKVFTTCTHNQVSYCIIKALGLAMLNGNEIYGVLKHQGRLPNIHLSVPEAILFAGKFAANIKEWKSVIYMEPLSTSLFENARKHLDEWNESAHAKKHNYLYIVLIADARTVLFIVNRVDDSISLVDSHQHSLYHGAVIAVVNKENFRCLCSWYSHVLSKYGQSNPSLYELSFLYYRRK